jgi:hypothetical protein
MGKAWEVGDRVVVFEVLTTKPNGKVVVTEGTLIRFV